MSSIGSQVLLEGHLSAEEFRKLDQEAQKAYLAILDKVAISDKSQKLSTYKPLPKQLPFHQSDAACRAIFGGNRSGKTTCGGMEFLFHITGNYPDWYPKDQRWSGAIKGRIVARDYAKGVGEIISPFMDEWLDKSLISRPIKNHQGIITKYFMKNGSVFDILTHEQDVEQFFRHSPAVVRGIDP